MKKEADKKQEQKREIGFFAVINIISGVIVLCFSILTLIMSIYSAAALFFVLAVFLFLPRKITKISNWLKFLIGIVVFFIIAIIAGVNLPTIEKEIVTHNLNENFVITSKNINYSVIIYNITKEKDIVLNGQAKTTSGFFLFINGAMTNLGKDPAGPSFYNSLEDSKNNTYTYIGYNFGEGLLQPNLKRSFYYIYETPSDASGLKFGITDDYKSHIISLGS